MTPLFSVILTARDCAGPLRASICSLLAQRFESWECFVLDDGSRDPTPGVFEEFKRQPRLHLHRFEDNRGDAVRRNFALKMAHGRFVSFLKAGDVWLPERLEAFAAASVVRPEAGFFFSNAFRSYRGRVVNRVFQLGRPIPEGRVPGLYAVGNRYLPWRDSNLAVRKEALDSAGGFREDVGGLWEAELFARLLAGGLRVAVLREALAVCRLSGASEKIVAMEWALGKSSVGLEAVEWLLGLWQAVRYSPLLAPREFERARLQVAALEASAAPAKTAISGVSGMR